MSQAHPPAALSSLVAEVSRSFDTPITTANLPVYRASSVFFDTLQDAFSTGARAAAGERHASSYATGGTPTTFALMDALAEIEGHGHAVRAALMPSGLTAIAAALMAVLRTGDHILMPDSIYGPGRNFSQGLLARMGVSTTFYDPAIAPEALAALMQDNTRVLYLESPGSYTFEIQDVPALCALARSRGVVTMIDNAWASPMFARPFDWGVDMSLLPLTKYWSGHADVLMGAVVAREALWPALHGTVRQMGICVGGDDAFLILRGMRTVSVRMQHHQRSALAVAKWLQQQPEVASVLHPALPSHPQHGLWQRDFQGASGLFSFELRRELMGDDEAQVMRRLAALAERRRFFRIGYSWGGYESLIVPARLSGLRTVRPWSGGPLVRVHIGLEDTDDLIADLQAGLKAIHHTG